MQLNAKSLFHLLNDIDAGDPFNFDGSASPGLAWFTPPRGNPSHSGEGSSVRQTSVGQTVLYSPDDDSVSATRAGGAGSGSTTASTSAAIAGSPFVINISWDASVSSAPSAFVSAVLAAAQYLESLFVNPVTLNISVGFGEIDGSTLGGNTLGASSTYITHYSYATQRNALASDATSPDDASTVASLPAISPVSGTFWATTSEAKALGLAPANGTSTDGYIGFSSSLPFTYNDANGVAAGSYDFFDVALHELTEVMGRLLFAGETIGGVADGYDLLDMLHYDAPGLFDYAPYSGYLSINGGVTDLANFNTVSGGDPGDWDASMGNDSYDAFTYSGVVNPMTQADIREMDALGWNLAAWTRPTGIAITPIPASAGSIQASAGLTPNVAFATIAQTGGLASDAYYYSLGGSGAGAFTLVTAANAATLRVGAAGVAGAAGGRLYALDITATDATNGNSSPAMPLNIIVASAGADTVNVASLSGALGTASPTFIYGLAGNDRINGAGMTAALWIIGGQGADTMTGGSGPNSYLYAAASESTAIAMDVITNFNAAKDTIDLRAMGVALGYAGKVQGSNLAAHSVGWQASGGNTFIYVNASGSAERLTATDMKIELAGQVSLNSGNILHA